MQKVINLNKMMLGTLFLKYRYTSLSVIDTFIREKAIVTKLSRLQWQKIYYLILGWFVFRFLKKKLTINKARLHTNKISAL